MRQMRWLITLVLFSVLVLNPNQIAASPGPDDEAPMPAPRSIADWGDAPDPEYPTLAASNGAHHYFSTLTLGATVDGDLDGQPNATATGDDQADTDDEDGVIFLGPFIPNKQTQMLVTVSESCFISAWIDFNGDGDWLDQFEQLYGGLPLAAGTTLMTVGVPFDAELGATYIRLRVTTVGALPPDGFASDGEVEDYMVHIEYPLFADGFDLGSTSNWSDTVGLPP